MSRSFKKILFFIGSAIGIIILIVVVAAFAVGTEFSVERSVEIEQSREIVFDYVRYLENQNKYSVWVAADPDLKIDYRGTDGTVGSVSAWKGNEDAGRGEQKIIGITEGERIDFELRFYESFESPRELVFEVHYKCKHLMNWYGGEEWPLSKCEMDFREGGRWSYCFEMPEEDPCGLAKYKEISRLGKIIYKDHFLDEKGEISKELPASLITLDFTEENDKTSVVNRWEYPTDSDLDLMLEMGAINGLTKVWSRLNEYLIQIQTMEKNEENN